MGELKRVLSYPVILLIVVNSIMGTGIFFLPALGAKVAGPASLISWALLSVIGLYIASCFGELTSMFPESGGIYEFSKHAYGRFVSFLVGWLALVTANLTIAMLIVGAIKYLLPFDANLPIIILSLVLIIVFNVIAYRGMKVSATMLVTFAFITLGTILALTLPGLFSISSSNFQPFMPFGLPAIFLAVFLVAETFFGWESPTYLAGEVKDGEKVMPKALVHGTLIISIISFFFVLAAIGSAGWKDFGNTIAPLSALAQILYGSKFFDVFSILVYLAIIGSVADWVVSAPRLILSMAKDKLFLKSFAAIHPKHATPYKAIILQTIISCFLVILGAGSYLTLLELLLPMLLIQYCLVMFSVVVLRFKKPDIKRYFRVWFGKIGPIVICLILAVLLVMWMIHTSGSLLKLELAFSFFLLGIPLYFLIEMYYDPKAVRFVDNLLVYLTLWTERLSLPLSVRRDIIGMMGDIKGKTILEFGCSVGTFTMYLAEEVGSHGKIFATSLSEKEIMITHRRAKKRGHHHVVALHDAEHTNRVHPSVPQIHMVVSVGALGYVQDIDNVLKDMNKRLEIGSKIFFVDYDKIFDLIRNVAWIGDDSKIKEIFSKNGFTVDVLRKQGFAWKYVYIYGVKFREA